MNTKKFFIGKAVGTIIVMFIIVVNIIMVIINNKTLKTYKSKYDELEKREILYMEVINDTITPTSLSYKIHNNTSQEVTYGVAYEIECYKDNIWQSYSIEIDWIAIGIIMKPDSSNEEKVEWEKTYGKLPKGKYRIIKSINNMTLYDEFKIR